MTVLWQSSAGAPLGVMLGLNGGNTRVTQSLCGLGRVPGVKFCVVLAVIDRNPEDEELGQPRQVMAARTHGPSGQLIFD